MEMKSSGVGFSGVVFMVYVYGNFFTEYLSNMSGEYSGKGEGRNTGIFNNFFLT